MADETEFSNQLAETEAALASLLPRPSRIDRDRMLFLAGRASANDNGVGKHSRNGTRFWQFSTALMTLVAVGFGVALWNQSESRMVLDMTNVEHSDTDQTPTVVPENEESTASVSPGELLNPNDADFPSVPSSGNDNRKQYHYLRLREIALADGIDAIPASKSYAPRVSTEPSSYGELMQSLLQREHPRKRVATPGSGLFDWTSFFVPGETL